MANFVTRLVYSFCGSGAIKQFFSDDSRDSYVSTKKCDYWSEAESETVYVRAALMKVHSFLGRRSRYPPYKSNTFHRGSIKPYGSLKNATGLGPD